MNWTRITTGRGELGCYWQRGQQEIRPLLAANLPTDVVVFELVNRGRAVAPPFDDLRAAKAAARSAA